MYSCATAQQLLGAGVRKYSQAHRNGNALNWVEHYKMPAGECYQILFSIFQQISTFYSHFVSVSNAQLILFVYDTGSQAVVI